MESLSYQENENAAKNFHCKNCKLAFLSYEQVSKHVRTHHLKDLTLLSALQTRTSSPSELQAQTSSFPEPQNQSSTASSSTDYRSILEAYLKKNKEPVTGRGILEDLLSGNVKTSDSTKTEEKAEDAKTSGLDEAEIVMMKDLGLITDNLLDLYEDDIERLKEDGVKSYDQNEQIETLSSRATPSKSEIHSPTDQLQGEILEPEGVVGGFLEPEGVVGEILAPEGVVSEECEASSEASSKSSSEDELECEEKQRKKERNEEIKSMLVRKFGKHEYLRIDPYFQHLWMKSFEKKDNKWQSHKLADVVDEHMWANTEKR